jgi:hypothetical protein
VIRLRRSPVHRPALGSIVALLALVSLVAACAPTGALGTPATPVVTAEPSGEPTPSDVAPATASATPTTAPVTPSGSPASSSSPVATPTPKPTATSAPAGTTIVRAYFILGSFTDNAGLAPVLREVPETKAVATAAMHALLDGPNRDELSARPAMYTSVPDGTRLLDLTIANGVATVNLSKAFEGAKANFQAAPAEAQVVYTLTQFATVDAVRIQVEGQAYRTGQVTRADYQVVGILPAIFVDRPAWGAAIGNPGRVSGLANVFEATFLAQLRDANDRVLVEKQVMASCGTGCWGTFKVDLPYTVGKAQYGTLRVYVKSAKDGSPENVTEYPVWLTPAS